MTRPAARSTASPISAIDMLSKSTTSARAASACSSSSSEVTSISIRSVCGACSRAAAIARAIRSGPPIAARWLSLINIPSLSPNRWLRPPPWRTAAFSSRRRPGLVLRVSTIRAFVPWTAST